MNKIIRVFIAVVATITLQLNIPTLLDKGEIRIEAVNALTITPPDTVVDDDWAGLPIGTTVFFPTDPNGHIIGLDAFATINTAYLATPAGATIYVAPGTYTTNNVISKPINIIGSGYGNNPAIDTVTQNAAADVFVAQSSSVSLSNMYITTLGAPFRGIVIIGIANNLSFSNLHITRCLNNIHFQPTANINNMQVTNCISDFARTSAFYFETNSTTRQNSVVNNLLIQDCFLSDSPYGIYAYQPPLNTFPLRPNDFRNITIRNTRFERITYKGVYAERLQDALFDGITMVDCGNDPIYTNPNGINLNLKYADFSNITIQNSTFTRCRLTEKQNAACIYIEGRANNQYFTNPATLTNVNIINCTIDQSTRGLVEGKSTDVNIFQTQIYNCTMGVTTMGVTNFLMERCVIMNNNRTLLPFYAIGNTYGVAIAGRLYPNTTFGPFFGATNATIRYCVFCGHQHAGLANADEVLNVRQFGFIPSSIDARYNWWGANDGPSSMAPGHGDPIGPATITYNPWLTMRISASNSQIILGGQTSIITVYLDRLSDGTVPSSTIMDGILGVTFTTTLGLFENGLASITKTITGGESQATLHSTSNVGDATVQAYTGCSSIYSVCQTTVKIIGNVVFEIRKSARKSALTKGENASFVILVTNKGNVPALNVVLTDAYPKELAYISSMPSGSQGLDKVTFNVGTLLPGRTESFEITFKLDDKIDIPEGKLMVTNEAIVTGNNYYTGLNPQTKTVQSLATRNIHQHLTCRLTSNGMD